VEHAYVPVRNFFLHQRTAKVVFTGARLKSIMRTSTREPRSAHRHIQRAAHIRRGIWITFLSALVFAQQPRASPRVRAKIILEEALDDKNPDTRKLAVIAQPLRRLDMKSKRTFPKLRNALDDRVPEVSFAAAKALFALHDPTKHLKHFVDAYTSGYFDAGAGFVSTHLSASHTSRARKETWVLFALAVTCPWRIPKMT
jgi:hypothetical protein